MMLLDPGNPVIKLCVEGMQAEGAGRPADARALFEEAWNTRTDDFEACIAAHYLARHQPTPEDTLHWNRESLRYADLVADNRVGGFYPSLHLNLGHSLETIGDIEAARRHYHHAAERLADLPPSPYADMVRRGVAEGCRRTEDGSPDG